MDIDPRAIYEAELARLKGEKDEPEYRFPSLDLVALMNGEGHDIDWLVEDIWPIGRSLHLHAQRKAGKSLVTLWMACSLAVGRDPFTGMAITPQVVGYWDQEMTEDDLRERLIDMGFKAEQLGNLHYYLHQPIPPLDTEKGGMALVSQAVARNETVLIIDTMSRVISGDENSADTYINFYRFTGQPLKSHGISLLRLDHEGHEAGRSRGSSAKADDVDIVWQLKPSDDGVQFVRKAARISWVPENVFIRKADANGLAFSRQGSAWPEGTKEKATELDEIGVPIDAGRRIASRMLKDAGKPVGRTLTLTAALKYRKDRLIFP